MTGSLRISAGARARRRVLAPLTAAAGLAWLVLALGTAGVPTLALCSAAVLSLPSPDALGLLLTFVSPWSLALGWALMVVAMMAPTAFDPLFHLRERSLRSLRPPCLALFLGGYLGVWLLAGPVFLGAAIAIRLAVPHPLALLAAASIVAAIWQVSPPKQTALNRCHRRPTLAAFAPAAYRSALTAGVQQGLWCLASCWPLMAAAVLAPAGHLAAMALVAAFVWAERLEPAGPARWRVRLPARTLRMAARAASRP